MPKTNIINCAEQAEISLINCVLENTQADGDVYPILYAEGRSNVVLRSTTIMENPKLYMKMYVGNGKLEMDDCVFQDCKTQMEYVDFKMNNSTIYAGDGNTIHAVRCDMQIENSTIKGCDQSKGYPAVWLGKCMVSTASTCVMQPGFDTSVYIKDASSLHSERDEFTSVEIDDAKAVLQNTVIHETVTVQNQAAVCILGELNILGENDDKIDLGVMNNSVVYGDALTLNHVNTPNIRMTGNSEYSCAMKSHFRKSGNQMSGKWRSSYASLLAQCFV